VEVSDDGEGIDPAVLSKLFTAFEQGEVRSRRQFAGLGLGLAICKKLIEAQGGTIAASSEGRGKGATFAVELPAVRGPAPVRGPRVREAAPGAVRPLRVLLVEDNEPTLRVMTRLLERLGHQVTAAPTMAGGLAAARRQAFDLLLSDLGLPDGSGLDLMRELRRQFDGRAVALTGYGMEEDVQRSRDAGFAAHLTKPIDIETLEDTVRKVMQRAEEGA
jgi:CheY-like chemotaxis protein